MLETTRGTADAACAMRAASFALLAALALLHVAGYALTTVVTDTARDVGAAWRIVHEAAWPLRGPQIGQRWSLGPAWFYLLAPIVALARSMTAVALCVGVLAALKLPLAWLLGRTLVDARFGFLFAFVLALPGWASLEHVVFAHTNLAGTATLALGLAALAAWRSPGALRCGVAGLAFAFALHAHPSALLLAPLALAGVFSTPRSGGAIASRLVAFGLGAVLLFVPVLVAEARVGWPMLQRSAEYAASVEPMARLARMPQVVAGVWVSPFVLVRDFLLPQHGLARFAWGLFALALGGGVLAGLVRAARARAALPFAVGSAALAASAALALLHDTVAFYFVLPLLPLVALAIAFALDHAWPERRAAVIVAIGACTLAANLAVLGYRAGRVESGEQFLPRAALGDVARAPLPDPIPVDFLAVAYADAVLVPRLCGAARPASLHGDLATQLELAQGLPLLLACERGMPLLALGGRRPPHLAALPAALLARAGIPVRHGGHVVFGDVTALHPSHGARLALHADYPPQPFELALDERVALTTRADAARWLAITELNPAFVAVAEPVVRADGRAIAPRARSASTRLYRCAACRGEVEWSVEVATGEARWVDVFLFAPESAPRGGGDR